VNKVASHGGYVWRYSNDLTLREGEGVVDESTIWIQPPGTPSVGEAFVRLFEATGDPLFREAALASAEALRQNEGFLERAQAISHTGHWYYDIATGNLHASRETRRIFEKTEADPIDTALFLQHLDTKYRPKVDRAWNRALNGKSFTITCSITIGTHSKWIELCAETEFTATGEPAALLGILRDITEQVKNDVRKG